MEYDKKIKCFYCGSEMRPSKEGWYCDKCGFAADEHKEEKPPDRAKEYTSPGALGTYYVARTITDWQPVSDAIFTTATNTSTPTDLRAATTANRVTVASIDVVEEMRAELENLKALVADFMATG